MTIIHQFHPIAIPVISRIMILLQILITVMLYFLIHARHATQQIRDGSQQLSVMDLSP
jgi:hypothetical protein